MASEVVYHDIYYFFFIDSDRILGRIQDLTKGGSDKRPPKAVGPRGVQGHASPENF